MALTAALSALASCSGPGGQVHTGSTIARSTGVPSTTAAAATSANATSAGSTNRRALGTPVEEALPVELLPMAGGKQVLAIADLGERMTWARTIDESGAMGKLRGFADAHVVTAVASGGRTTFVTSDGDRICVTTFADEAEVAATQGCETARPEMVVSIGERLALLSLDIAETPSRIARAKAPAAGSGGKKSGAKTGVKDTKGGAKKTDATKTDAGGVKVGAKKSDTTKTDTTKTDTTKSDTAGTKVGATKAGATNAGGAKGSAAKKRSKGAGAAKASARKAAKSVITPPAKAKVDVRVAWASREGVFDASRAVVGLTFERPLAGMTLVDAVARGEGADVLFYEAVAKPKVRSKTPLGSARLGVASLGADGALVAGTRAALAEGDLEYGYIAGQTAPRFVAGAGGTVLVTFAGRGAGCRAERVLPALAAPVVSRAGCAVDPAGWALGGGGTPQASAAAERLLAADPRRAPGQTRGDAPLVMWAGERGVFGGVTGLGAAARSDGAPSPVVAPFGAKRARLAWGAFAPDGAGVAVVGGRVFRIDDAGAVSEAVGSEVLDGLGPRTAEVVRGAAGAANDRRRAALIGDGVWVARGDVVRVLPQPMKLGGLAGRAHVDATSLVGGRERGMFVEVASGALRVTFVAKDGALGAGPPLVSSPVRAGFDATERGGAGAGAPPAGGASAGGVNGALAGGASAGGAIVAGVSALDPTKVVAFVIDAEGKVGAPHATSLGVTAGTFAVRVTALPGGGALLTDEARKRVVWLDDDATERAAAPWPDGHADAMCVDGRPAPLSVPSPEPGKFVRVAELAAPGTCISGDVAWTRGGALRWFGSSVRGLESIAEVGTVDALAPAMPAALAPTTGAGTTAATAPATTVALATGAALSPTAGAGAAAVAAPSSLAIACPAEMVSIAGRFCIDRFEAALVDVKTWRVLSPDYPSTPNLLEIVLGDWATDRAHWGDVHARAFPLPAVPSWQRGAKTEPLALARFGARPSGYVTGLVAEGACRAAGKRLCVLEEFTTACRGEADTDFPYGSEYQDGVCNVYREEHPAALLHHNASLGHLDPRLNRVRARGRALFETTGARAACRSNWGSDAVYDLVGNLDEWVDEGGGAFAGGFYARSTRAGCDAVITAHPKVYADYSTGVRCCKDAAGN